MASPTRLTLVIEGLESDAKDVDFRVFTAKLEAVRAALRHAETPDTKDIRYKVVDLRHTSATLVLEAEEPGPIRTLLETISAVRTTQNVVGEVSEKLFEDIKELASGVGERFSRIKLFESEARSAAVDVELCRAVQAVELSDTVSFGTVKGAVERFNSHDDANYFYIYPRQGGSVKCFFRPDLLLRAVSAVERNTTVTGLLRYRKGKFHPYECAVKTIEVHPKDEELPKFSDIAGRAPGLTGEQSTIDFIRRIRSGWQD